MCARLANATATTRTPDAIETHHVSNTHTHIHICTPHTQTIMLNRMRLTWLDFRTFRTTIYACVPFDHTAQHTHSGSMQRIIQRILQFSIKKRSGCRFFLCCFSCVLFVLGCRRQHGRLSHSRARVCNACYDSHHISMCIALISRSIFCFHCRQLRPMHF